MDRLVFQNIKSLTGLEITRNKLKFLHEDVFADLTALTTIDLSFNQIEKLAKNIFASMLRLRIVKLDSNRVAVLDKDLFAKNLQLEEIIISKNYLKRINADFTRFSKVRMVDLRENACISFPNNASFSAIDIFELQSIITLNCTRNAMSFF